MLSCTCPLLGYMGPISRSRVAPTQSRVDIVQFVVAATQSLGARCSSLWRFMSLRADQAHEPWHCVWHWFMLQVLSYLLLAVFCCL
jgi:hypothetical protein